MELLNGSIDTAATTAGDLLSPNPQPVLERIAVFGDEAAFRAAVVIDDDIPRVVPFLAHDSSFMPNS